MVRYQVLDVDRSVHFYTQYLGFTEQRPAPMLAIVTRGALHLVLSGAGSSGSRNMPDGTEQRPGGWNRIVIYVENLQEEIDDLQSAGVHFRNQVEQGPGGKQVLIEDPDGNPIELHEAPSLHV
jgi:catechol 2,3-dioxygenase-like lactoylglutathione lyase family enzyme